MVMLVTLAEAKVRLRYNHDEEDGDLTSLIGAASGAVLNYLKVAETYYDDSSGEIPLLLSGGTDVPGPVKTATLYLVGVLARDRDGINAADWERGYLPNPVVSLLYPLRDPAMT
jgi:hypothetical protein